MALSQVHVHKLNIPLSPIVWVGHENLQKVSFLRKLNSIFLNWKKITKNTIAERELKHPTSLRLRQLFIKGFFKIKLYTRNGQKSGQIRTIPFLSQNRSVRKMWSKYFKNYDLQVEHKETIEAKGETDRQRDKIERTIKSGFIYLGLAYIRTNLTWPFTSPFVGYNVD